MPNETHTESPRRGAARLPVSALGPLRLPNKLQHQPFVVPKKSLASRRFGESKSFAPKQHVFREHHPAHSIFLIERGIVLTYRMTILGHRRIVGIHTAGDLLGLTTDDEYRLSSQCVTPVTVRIFEREDFFSRVHRRDRASQFVWPSIFNEYLRSQEHIVLLGTSAMERVAGFILRLADRSCTADSIELNITRRDIADYLSLTIETVSRMLTELKNEGTIRIENVHTVRIVDRAALEHRGGEK